jgi:hypothetical protein
MLLDDVSLLMFETTLVQIIDVIAMANGLMPASGLMSMRHLSAPFRPPS